MPLKRPDAIAPLLLGWYDLHRRDLPWRAKPGEAADPYRVWLSEVMLQQTTVATVRPRFEAWVARWPDVASLAASDEAEVMSAWAGLGYYARARNLVRTARAVAGSGFPEAEAELRRLPGLGDYTAAAVAAIAFGARAVVVDANVERVVARLAAIDTPLPAARPAIRAAADAVTPDERAGDFAQGMMDLGATICTPRTPRCLLCPLRGECAGFATGAPEAFPVKAAKKVRPRRFGTVFWLERTRTLPDTTCTNLFPGERRGPVTGKFGGEHNLADGPLLGPGLRRGTGEGTNGQNTPAHGGTQEILLVRRPSRGLLGGMRALPTGAWADAPPGLDSAPAVADWRVLPETVEHAFTHFTLQLALAVGRAHAHADGEWWPVDRLDEAGLPTVFARAAEAMRRGR